MLERIISLSLPPASLITNHCGVKCIPGDVVQTISKRIIDITPNTYQISFLNYNHNHNHNHNQIIVTMSDLSVDNITAHTIQTNSSCPDPRTRYIFERLVTHLHDFARETRLSTPEWTAAITFLTQTGQKCTSTRQEFILLSDILGLSSLLDSIDHPSPPGTTQGTLLGPFHTHDAQHLPAGAAISHDTSGKPLFVLCTVRATNGTPLKDVRVDIWHADSTGLYDVQYSQRDAPEGRGVLHSDASGRFWFSAIQPVPYPVPDDGPVGKLLTTLGRHQWRPAHMHFILAADGYERLVT